MLNKKILTLVALIVLTVGVTGCQNTSWIDKISDRQLNESIEHQLDLSKFDEVTLIIEMSVSDINVVSTDHKDLTFVQKANKKDLLAEMDVDTDGKSCTVTFKNKSKIINISGNQSSKAELKIPADTNIVFDATIDVGKLTVAMDKLSFISIHSRTNVGEIEFSSTKSQPQLETIELMSDVGQALLKLKDAKDLKTISASTDVGDIDIELLGQYSALENINIKSSTGKINTSLLGEFSTDFIIDSQSDVGDNTIDFGGKFNNDVTGDIKSNIGEITLYFSDNQSVDLFADIDKFTSSIDIVGLQFKNVNNNWTQEGSGSNIKLDLSIDVGDIQIKSSR